MKSSWLVRTIVAVILSSCLITALLSLGKPEQLARAFGKITPTDLAVWSGLYGLLLVFRAFRFKQAYSKPGALTLIRAISVQGGLNRIMPFRLGELSLPYLIAQREQHPNGAVLFALGWVRLLEFCLVSSGLLLGCLLMGRQTNEVTLGIISVVAIVCTVMFVLVDPTIFAQTFSRRMNRAQGFVRRLHPKIGRMWTKASESLEALPSIDRIARFRLMIWSLVVYGMTLGLYDTMLQSMGVSVTLSALLIGVGAAQISSVLPLLTIGSVGLHEAGWASGFVFAGLATDVAISSGVLTQCATLLLGIIYAVISYVAVRKKANQ